jgi:hypothetical protein
MTRELALMKLLQGTWNGYAVVFDTQFYSLAINI